MTVYGCIRCGFCCTVAPCNYGEVRPGAEDYQCRYLTEEKVNGERHCQKYDEIREREKDSRTPMHDDYCSSALYNDMRDALIRRKENA